MAGVRRRGVAPMARYLGPVGNSAGAGRLRGLLARWAKKRVGQPLGSGVGVRRVGDAAVIRLTRGSDVGCGREGKEEDGAVSGP